jgi:hypothetical protein
MFSLEQNLTRQEEIAELQRGRSQSFMRQETLGGRKSELSNMAGQLGPAGTIPELLGISLKTRL